MARIVCSAGNSVKITTHVSRSPAATQSPISWIGRMPDTASAAKPIVAAAMDAVVATNLSARANTWCSRTGVPSGHSAKRDWM